MRPHLLVGNMTLLSLNRLNDHLQRKNEWKDFYSEVHGQNYQVKDKVLFSKQKQTESLN